MKGHNGTQVTFKNCASFSKSITKIDRTKYVMLNIQISLCQCIVCQNTTQILSDKTRSLWFYSKAEVTNFNVDIANNDYFKSFEYKAKLTGNYYSCRWIKWNFKKQKNCRTIKFHCIIVKLN